MVDVKHRYGSNLRAYHDSWKKKETLENFFYWLDYGEGKNYEHPTVSRERLEKEQVRYLSREERMKYLVKIDEEGRLCWAKNGERISTTPDYKDSLEGIVPRDDKAPAYAPGGKLGGAGSRRDSSSSSSSSSSDATEHSDIEGEHYVNEDLQRAKGLSKIKHVSAATILNHLLRGSVKPNSWIFVSMVEHCKWAMLTFCRSQTHRSVSISASSNQALSNTVPSCMARVYRQQGYSRSKTDSFVVFRLFPVTIDRRRRTFAHSYTP